MKSCRAIYDHLYKDRIELPPLLKCLAEQSLTQGEEFGADTPRPRGNGEKTGFSKFNFEPDKLYQQIIHSLTLVNKKLVPTNRMGHLRDTFVDALREFKEINADRSYKDQQKKDTVNGILDILIKEFAEQRLDVRKIRDLATEGLNLEDV